MTASSRGSKAMLSILRSSRTSGTTRTRLHVCSQCTITLSTRPNSTRNYAAAAAALKTETTAPITEQVPSPSPSKSTNPYTIKAGVLLSRPPLLTRLPTAFESAYMFYQKRLNERLAIPFTRYFYFKKDTPADNDWKLKAKLRNGTPARELGGYNPYSSEGWNDEVLVGDQVSTREHLVDSLVKDSIMAINDDGSIKVKLESEKDGKPVELEAGQETLEDMESEGRIERPLERETTADTQVDVKRLDRCLDRTLYLVVQNEKGYWTFPTGELAGKENLHQAAERVLVQSSGVNMNTWIVGNAPVGHRTVKARYHLEAPTVLYKPGEKIFFMKGRIMAGQVNLKGNKFGLKDWKWLTREELESCVPEGYWSSIKGMLASR